jgi:hypothetical protein
VSRFAGLPLESHLRALDRRGRDERGEIRQGLTNETFKKTEKLESDLWETADNLRAKRKLASATISASVGSDFSHQRHQSVRGSASADQGRPGKQQDAQV